MLNCQNVYSRICDSLENLIECECDAPNLDGQLLQINDEIDCGGSLTPLPNPLGSNCHNCHNNSECQSRRKQLQQRWTIRQTRGNVRDWWDRVSLEHQIITPGCGRRPRCNDRVIINYVTKDLEGKGLDWSRKPYSFSLSDPKVMLGLRKGVRLMRRGETAKLYIPAEMAYGWQGVEGLIKPDTDLVIKVTLKKIVSV